MDFGVQPLFAGVPPAQLHETDVSQFGGELAPALPIQASHFEVAVFN